MRTLKVNTSPIYYYNNLPAGPAPQYSTGSTKYMRISLMTATKHVSTLQKAFAKLHLPKFVNKLR